MAERRALLPRAKRGGRALAGAATIALATLALAGPARAADPTILRFAFPQGPKSYVYTDGVMPWAKAVTEASGGAVQVKLFPGPQLANNMNVYDRTVNGVIELGYGAIVVPDLFPKSMVTNLPFVDEDSVAASVAFWRLYATGVTASDYAKVHVISLFTVSSSAMHTTRPVHRMEDLKGVKIAGLTRIVSDCLVRLGAVPITMTPLETYQALSRGLIEGTPMSFTGVFTFKLQEVAHHHFAVPFGLAPTFIIMNHGAWDRLPAATKAAIDARSGESMSRRVAEAGEKADEAIQHRLASMPGQEVTTLAPAELARWKIAFQPIVDAWVKATPDGARILSAFESEMSKVRSGK